MAFNRNNYKTSIDYLTSAIKRDDSYADAYYFRGLAFHNKNAARINQDHTDRDACNDWRKARSRGNKEAGRLIDKYCR